MFSILGEKGSHSLTVLPSVRTQPAELPEYISQLVEAKFLSGYICKPLACVQLNSSALELEFTHMQGRPGLIDCDYSHCF